MLENKFKTKLISELEILFPGCMVFHLGDFQGIPDLLILYKDRWAALEGKKSEHSHHQPNQDFYIETMNDMSYASFIYPENKQEVLYELQQAFKSKRSTRVSKR